MKVGIIGGGISGLTVAYYLQKMGIPYDLFEQNELPGGNLKTVKTKNYVLEMGANALSMTDELQTLIRELKLENEVILAKPEAHKKFVLQKGRFLQIPETPVRLLGSNFFSLKTRYKMLQEIFRPAKPLNPLETVSQFFERRFSREVVDKAIAPLTACLFAGDPEALLMQNNLPGMLEAEQKKGSVLKGFLQNPPGRTQLFSFREGLQTLALSIASKLIEIHTAAPVEMVTRSHGKYIVSTTSPDYSNSEYDILVVALPAHKATVLLEFTFPGMAAALRNVNQPPVCVVHTAYRKADVGVALDGSCGLHPKTEKQFTLGSFWSSSIFEERCPPAEVLFTTFIGGTTSPENTRKPRAEILKTVHEELKRNYQISADRPVFQHFHLWSHAQPQADLFIEDARQLSQTLEKEQVFITGNWDAGMRVSACIKQAAETAKKIQALEASQSG